MNSLAARLAVVSAFTFVGAVLGAFLQIASPWTIERTIDPSDIHPLRGEAWAVTLPKAPASPLFELRGDTDRERRSRLRLYEDSRELPMPHAAQAAVEAHGSGRYLHLRETELYFSTSDGSNARENGMRYSYRVPVMLHAGITFSLFAIGAALFAAARAAAKSGDSSASPKPSQEAVAGVPAGHTSLGSTMFLLTALAFAVGWLVLVWQPKPLVVDTGDGGTVSSIAASRLDRTEFANDPVLGSAATTAFYVSAVVPLTTFLARWTGDVGQAYVLPIAAILFLQLLGFFRLGLQLFCDYRWAALLAALSVPPVYVFTGELWGQLAMPLPRGFFGALLPWLLLGLLDHDVSRSHWRPYALMLACGLAAWIHPVSAPSIAFGLWLALACQRPEGTSRNRHGLRMIASGLLFVGCILPIALWLFGGFGANVGDESTRELAGRAIRSAAGPRYFDVLLLLRNIVGNGWGWVWLVWIAGTVALVRRRKRTDPAGSDARLLRWFLVGVLLSSIGIAAVDQLFAHLRGRAPVQIDLVRNVRFVVPLLLIGATWFLSDLWRRAPGPGRRAVLAAAATLLLIGWWHRHPTPPVVAITTMMGATAPKSFDDGVTTRAILRQVASLPREARVLPLGDARSEGAIELTGLAVRYAAFQPVAFLPKDLNLLSYSAAEGMREWFLSAEAWKALHDEPAGALQRLVRRSNADYVLLHAESVSEAVAAAAFASGAVVAAEGPWHLIAVTSFASQD